MDTDKFSTPEWLTNLINNTYKYEGGKTSKSGHLMESNYRPNIRRDADFFDLGRCTTLLPDGGRRYIWSWCSGAGLKYHGVPGQACELFERYVAKKVLNKMDADVLMREIKDKAKLVAGCCIMLAAKMLSRSSYSEKTLRTNIFKEYYQNIDVARTETKIFEALDFYVPPRTTVEIAQILAVEIKVDGEVFKIIDYVVSKGELFKPTILMKVQWAADLRGKVSIHRLHLAAAGVMAASVICGAPDPSPQLALLTHASALYITTLSAAILDVIPEDDV